MGKKFSGPPNPTDLAIMLKLCCKSAIILLFNENGLPKNNIPAISLT